MKKPDYILRGEVVHGRGKGHTFGLPTANLEVTDASLLPPEGVYIASALIAGVRYAGVTNVGTRPTLDRDDDITVETFLIDFSGDLYGETLEVCLFTRLRGLSCFESVEALREQISRDEQQALAFFAGEGDTLLS